MWNIDDLFGFTKPQVKRYIADHMDLMTEDEQYRNAYVFAVEVARNANILHEENAD